jgi:hypothetical protein
MNKIFLIILLIVTLSFSHGYAWDGYDHDSEDYIEIENPALVVPGQDIEIYDHSDETYHDVYVISVQRNGTVVIEVFDNNTGDYRTFEMMDEVKTQETAIFHEYSKS